MFQTISLISLRVTMGKEESRRTLRNYGSYLFLFRNISESSASDSEGGESQEDQEVYFDDMRIVHENSTASFKVTQVNEYYPYGMQTDKSWRADGYIDPGLMYQSGYASYDSLTGYYDFLFRSYDPALGRFFATDPMAASTPSYSPYHANFNNPISFVDPLGLSPRDSRIKDFGGTFNSDAGITANFGQLGYIGAFDAPTAVDYRPSATLRFIASIVGQLMSTSFGGEWTQNGGMSSYASLKEAFGAGVAYNNANGSWDNTVAGSEGKADFRLNALTAAPLAKKGVSGPELAEATLAGPNLTQVGEGSTGANGVTPPAVSVNLEDGGQDDLIDVTDKFNNQLKYTSKFFSNAAENIESLAIEEDWSSATLRIAKLEFFKSQVGTNAPFDLKRNSGGFSRVEIGLNAIYNGKVYRYDDFGNINYGFAAKVFGLSLFEALGGAGYNQTFQTRTPDFSNLNGFFDHSRDTRMIKFGYNMN